MVINLDKDDIKVIIIETLNELGHDLSLIEEVTFQGRQVFEAIKIKPILPAV